MSNLLWYLSPIVIINFGSYLQQTIHLVLDSDHSLIFLNLLRFIYRDCVIQIDTQTKRRQK